MQTLKFKSNIKCNACVAKVTNVLNETVGEDNWQVDIMVPQKTLTVQSEKSASEIESAIKTTGFSVEEL